ncbi:DUF2306 domain-containing protein [Cohnella sp. REN36]|uniref:DUF2306 domain-containing protein n=1 Tax=Cohnella sp. REN36 TaxID=2887347 RepID=UPI001D152AA6|nr:DUF2306 domain-containing protein [Cohnella sp. REN36]MCC3371449.1 DUF2306 domain-containing protein [Cohnella sp. REN36]
MSKRNRLFGLLAVVSIVFIVYALVKNYLVDPGAESFLSHKTGLKRELHLSAWLSVMRVHVAFACIAMAAGLLNFSNRLFEKSRKFHRINGYVYVMSVLIVIITSGYMAPYATGGTAASMGFNLLNLIWLGITAAALVHIRQKRIVRHRNGMIRSYAFCFTNMSIHLLTTVLNGGFGIDYSNAYTFGVYGSIVLLLIVPGIVVRLLRPIRAQENT